MSHNPKYKYSITGAKQNNKYECYLEITAQQLKFRHATSFFLYEPQKGQRNLILTIPYRNFVIMYTGHLNGKILRKVF